MVYNDAGKVDLGKGYWKPKRKLKVTTHLPEIIKLQLGKKYHRLFCILALFRTIVVKLSLKNAWFPLIFFLDFNSPC